MKNNVNEIIYSNEQITKYRDIIDNVYNYIDSIEIILIECIDGNKNRKIPIHVIIDILMATKSLIEKDMEVRD